MNLYEHTIVARQDTSPAQVKQLTEKYSKIVEKNEGEIVQAEDWGLLNLAYAIKKIAGWVFSVKSSFSLGPSKISFDMENSRVLSASLNKFWTKPYLLCKSLPIPTNCEPWPGKITENI